MARGRSRGHRAAGRLPVSVDGGGEDRWSGWAWRVLGASGRVVGPRVARWQATVVLRAKGRRA